MRGDVLKELFAFCRVHPLARPRLGKYTVYQPKEKQYELLDQIMNYRLENPIDEPVMVDVTIYFKPPVNYRRHPPKYPISNYYGDIDNLTKAVFDALCLTPKKGWGVISNDRLIVGGESMKLFGDEDYCRIRIYAMG